MTDATRVERLRPVRAAVFARRGDVAGLAVALSASIAAAVYFVRRVMPSLERPLLGDETVSGLVSASPLRELVEIVIGERGGPPLYPLLAHVALALEPSPAGLRWLSVALAVATIPVAYDLARRLAGHAAGITAAFVVAGSTAFLEYGSFGRMYTLFAFVAALAADLFVRALERRTVGAAVAAAAAAALLPAAHTFGFFPLAAEALVALAVWRGRPFLRALPVLAVGALVLAPSVAAAVRLTQRYSTTVGKDPELTTSERALEVGHGAVAGFAGGSGWTFAAFLLLGLAGFVVLVRLQPAFAALAALALVVPWLWLFETANDFPGATPRHLMYGLPFWAALVGAAVAVPLRNRHVAVRGVAVVAAVALAVLSPAGGTPNPVQAAAVPLLGEPEALVAPAAWVRERVGPNDVLFHYSPVWLVALDETHDAAVVETGNGATIEDSLTRVDFPARALFVPIGLGTSRLARPRLERRLRADLGNDVEAFIANPWTIVRLRGPFANERELLIGLDRAAAAIESASAIEVRGSEQICIALAEYGERCRNTTREERLAKKARRGS